jgi:hypothetical protein
MFFLALLGETPRMLARVIITARFLFSLPFSFLSSSLLYHIESEKKPLEFFSFLSSFFCSSLTLLFTVY